MFKKILFAYDGSEHSKRAAKLSGDIARMSGKAEIWLVCVMELNPKNLKQPYLQEWQDAQKMAGEKYFTEARKLIGKDVSIHNELLFGKAAENILELAEKKKCDLIIMGARGLSLLEGLLLGSQVHKVLTYSKCPVLAVK
jgi:nucleotide-binding universal stress UspA family protein